MRLTKDFFTRDVLWVAPELPGKRLCRRLPDGRVLSARITEAEAYRGEEDGACHARSGRTARTQIMYGEGGYAYIYLIYGLHWLFNVVTGPKDMPQAALIRALEPPLNGPAKWTKAFGVTGAQNGLYLPESEEIWLEEGEVPAAVAACPRVGIDYAQEPWRSMPWRLVAE